MKTVLLYLMTILLPVVAYSQSVTNLSPSGANAGQTLDVTITGSSTHFTDPNGTELYFGFGQGSNTTYINSLTVNSDVSMTANITIPLGTATGDYSVQPINSIDGIIAPMDFHVSGITAALSSLTPNTASPGQTLDVTITGTDTHFSDASYNNVTFQISQGSGTITVNSVTPVNNTTLVTNITIGADMYTGDYGVSVSNNLDLTMSLPGALHIDGFVPGQIVSVYPNLANPGQTTNMLISAENSAFTQSSNTIDIGFGQGVGVNFVDVFNDSLLLANVTVPPGTNAGYRTVTVSNSVNGMMIKNNGFLVPGPTTVTGSCSMAISPSSANGGQVLSVTITGTNTQFLSASATNISADLYPTNSSLSPLPITNLSIVDDVTLTGDVTLPSGIPSAYYDVSLSMSSQPQMWIYNGFYLNGTEPLFAFVVPEPESDENACDGSAEIFVSGGTPPYAYTFSGSSWPNTTIAGLCEGYYEATVSDGNGELVNLSFVIVPPNSVYTTQSYIDSLIADTVYSEVITECTIDFNTIDSIYIQSYSWLTANEIVVTWHVAYGAGQSTTITDVYDLGNFTGVFSLALEIFCPNKSMTHSLVAFDQLYYDAENPQTTGFDEHAFSQAVVYPNPFGEVVIIALPSEQETTVTLLDMTGKVLRTSFDSGKLIEFNTGDLAPGQYMLLLQSTGSAATRKIVKL